MEQKLLMVGLVAIQVGWVVHSAFAQSAAPPVTTLPGYSTTLGGNVSGSLTTTNAFQKVFSAMGQAPGTSGGFRKGCIIQNLGTGVLYVSEGTTTGSAVTSKSYQLTSTAPGNLFHCDQPVGVTWQGEVDLGGTSAGNLFYAVQY